jgi:capsular polysaccharide biosynthesis protein
MPAERLGNVFRRGWAFLALVAIATLVGSLIADAARSETQPARMEVLVAARMAGDGQYDIEVSRATASDFIVDDLGRIVRGTEFAGLVAARYSRDSGSEITPGKVAAALATDRTHRGLELRMTTPDAAKSVALAQAAADVLAEEIDVLFPTIYEVASLTLIDLAPVPGSSSDLVLDVTIREIAAIVIAAVLLVFWDVGRRRLYAEDVEDILDLPVLARFD